MSDMFETEKLREGFIKAALQAEELRSQLAERDVRIAELEAFATKMAIELTAFVITNEKGKVIGISFDRALNFQKEATKVLEKSLSPSAPASVESEDAPLWNCGKDAYLFARGDDYELIIVGDGSSGETEDKYMLHNLEEAKAILLDSGFGKRDLVGFPQGNGKTTKFKVGDKVRIRDRADDEMGIKLFYSNTPYDTIIFINERGLYQLEYGADGSLSQTFWEFEQLVPYTEAPQAKQLGMGE